MRHPQTRANAAAYRVAEDSHWMAAGSTSARCALREEGKQAPGPAIPLNVRVYELAEQHDQELLEYTQRHAPGSAPTRRPQLEAYAHAIAQQGDATARDEYEVLQSASRLRAALEIGDADEMLGTLTCPGCLCWSLIGIRPGGQWRCACLNLRCAPSTEALRNWSLADVARHNLAAAR